MNFPTERALANYLADEAEIRDTYWKPRPGETALDIGSSFGSYALAALASGAQAVAVDCDANAIEVFRQLCQGRGYDGFGGLVAAVGEPYEPELLDAIPEYMRPTGPWVTLDAVAVGLDCVDWIKIDVEGGEAGVLWSGLRTIQTFHPQLLVEDHAGVYEHVSREPVEEFLHAHGYEFSSVPYSGADGDRSYWVCA